MFSIRNLYSDMSQCFQRRLISLFRIIRKLSDVAYQLELSSHMTVYNIFHAWLLHLYNRSPSCFGSIRNPPALPFHIHLDTPVAATVERILGCRVHELPHNRIAVKFLVHWKHIIIRRLIGRTSKLVSI